MRGGDRAPKQRFEQFARCAIGQIDVPGDHGNEAASASIFPITPPPRRSWLPDEKTRVELEAAVYRRLVEHLRTRTDVQNIDLMNLAGFCRNCLSNWMKDAADAKGLPMSKDESREIVYGMPYDEWRAKYQKEATAGRRRRSKKQAKSTERRFCVARPVRCVDERAPRLDRKRVAALSKIRSRSAFIARSARWPPPPPPKTTRQPTASPRISSRRSSSASSGSKRKRKRSPTISATSTRSQGQRLRRQGAAHGGAVAQDGHQRAQGTGSHSGDLHARARDVVSDLSVSILGVSACHRPPTGPARSPASR